jgi:hypothetical protein
LINARSTLNKKDELRCLTDTQDFHFVFITESWLHDYIPSSLVFNCDKYNVFRKDRANSRGGGVCILIDKRYNALIVNDLIDSPIDEPYLEIMAVDVDFELLPIHYRLIVCYRPPGYSVLDMRYFKKFLSHLHMLSNSDRTVLITGDFNLPNISWSSIPSVVKHDMFHTNFLDFISEYGFSQFVVESTRAKNTLDLVLVNDPLVIHDCSISSPLGNSDHESVTFNLSLPAVEDVCNLDEQFAYDFKNADYDSLNIYVSSVNWTEILTDAQEPNECLDLFINVLKTGLDLYVPVKCICSSRRASIHYPLSVRKLQHKKCRAWRCYKQYKTHPLKLKYDTIKKKCDSAIDSFIKEQEERLITDGNLGAFYRYVNGKLTFKSGVSTLKDANGISLSDDMSKAERLSEYFASTFTEDNHILPQVSRKVNDNIELNNVDFRSDLVYKHLRNLNVKTSSGPDLLPALLFKNLARSLSFPLSLLFSKLFLMSALPDIWKTAIITPIYKKGPSSDASNYRPISLTCIMCKLMESVIKDALLVYLLKHGFINKQQHGFISKRSTCSQLLECINDWSVSLSHKQSTDAAYIDFRRAFDSVVHSKLYVKLKSLGINGNLLHWICDFLSNRSQAVRVANSTSTFRSVRSGVPQGSVLGPILFLVFINDIVYLFGSGLNLKLYADDVKMYTAIHDISSVAVLQSGLDKLNEWANEWQLSIAINKCSVLHIGNNNPQYSYNLQSVSLQNVIETTDLGIIVDNKLRFSTHYASIVNKAQQRSSLILRCFKCRDPLLLSRAFVVYVRPLLEYCSPVWAPVYISDISLIESVQRRFTKRISGMKDLTYPQRLTKLKLETLEVRRLKTDLITMFKILHHVIDIDFNEFFTLSNVTNLRGHRYKLSKSLNHNNARLFSFSCRRIDCWNSLPDSTVESESLNAFKTRLQKLDFTKYLLLSF